MNSRHPNHPRYCSPSRWQEIKRIKPRNNPPTTLVCVQNEYNQLGALIGKSFNVGGFGKVAGDSYIVAPTYKREGKDLVQTGARIQRDTRA